jgi:ankyrin repeat protein
MKKIFNNAINAIKDSYIEWEGKKNYIDPNYTDLHIAVITDDLDLARKILYRGDTDIFVKAANGKSALDMAIEFERHDIAEEIIYSPYYVEGALD